MKKNRITKIAAFIALLAIFSSIIGTGSLIIYQNYFMSTPEETLTQEQLQELLQNYSGSLSNSGEIITNTGYLLENTGSIETSSGVLELSSGKTLDIPTTLSGTQN